MNSAKSAMFIPFCSMYQVQEMTTCADEGNGSWRTGSLSSLSSSLLHCLIFVTHA